MNGNSSSWIEALGQNLESVRDAEHVLFGNEQPPYCIEVHGTAAIDYDPILAVRVEEFVRGATNPRGLNAHIVVAGPESGLNLARLAAATARKRAIVIEKSDEALRTNADGFYRHVSCVSEEGQHMLASRLCGWAPLLFCRDPVCSQLPTDLWICGSAPCRRTRVTGIESFWSVTRGAVMPNS